MKVTHVSLLPTEAAQKANRPALTPELLAATGARYSRSNDGLDAILSKIDPRNLDKSVDSIFKMVDYGHQSIADMAPVALFMDGISMWLAYHIWSLCPTAGGQESSTRYIKLSSENLPDAAEIGIPENLRDEWQSAMQSALSAYETALSFWENVALKTPSVTRIPAEILNDSSEKAQKTVARMRRNYAFDRARYFLPAALKTNVMMVQSARAWVSLCQQLLSHPLPEAQSLGEAIRGELSLVAPRLLKHAVANKSFKSGCINFFKLMYWENRVSLSSFKETRDLVFESAAFLEVFSPPEADKDFQVDLFQRENRYSYIGPSIQRTTVRFGWKGVAFADVRDLNRHRTGTKWCLLAPQGFYAALDQIKSSTELNTLVESMRPHLEKSLSLATTGDTTFLYWFLLGFQLPFEHTTTADKFIYEAELRTGLGAHYRYAKHLHDVLALWYEKFPATKGLILEGQAEPE